MSDFERVFKMLDLAIQVGADEMTLKTSTVSSLVAAYKQLHYQNSRKDRHVTSVTETDQNPA